MAFQYAPPDSTPPRLPDRRVIIYGLIAAVNADIEDDQICPICQSALQRPFTESGVFTSPQDQAMKLVACGHVFHDSCLQQWANLKYTCPLCRRPLEVECFACFLVRQHTRRLEQMVMESRLLVQIRRIQVEVLRMQLRIRELELAGGISLVQRQQVEFATRLARIRILRFRIEQQRITNELI
ncbi:hypothetical protein CC78DRAFT_20982 [Lojkania enalia]|uniref:RING-type domain-containing protein n=1 Tax=Lojkania enalia TaxID=147567 RepID=A0A9P4KFS0_9PLEO|nr:hypothetical protein CC78DRAFT_20982 [Didymosphaeria enalia]